MLRAKWKLLIFCLVLVQVYSHALTMQDTNLQAKIKLHTESVHKLDINTYINHPHFLIPTDLLAPFAKSTGERHERVDQTYKGVRVFGSQLIYHWDGSELKSISGRVAKIHEIETQPSLSEFQIKHIVQLSFPQIRLMNFELIIYPTQDKSYLAYKVEQADSIDESLVLFVDAHDGQILDSYDQIGHGTGKGVDGVEKFLESIQEDGVYYLKSKDNKVMTYDMSESFDYDILPGELIKSENDYYEDPAAVDAHFYATKFLEFLSEIFKRDSFDNKGSKIVSSVHYQKNYVNAFWSPIKRQMVFGDGDGKMSSPLSGAFDVIAHEISHAITDQTSRLIYRNESGALNESFSDVIATFAEYIIQPEKFDYLIAEDVWTPNIGGDALRYLDNPIKNKKNVDHYDEIYKGLKDNGGVHINSGISNLAFYLLAEGGAHPRFGGEPVIGIGIEKAGMIFWETFTTRLVYTSKFEDLRREMIALAFEKFNEDVANSVSMAWSAVGVIDSEE